MLRLIEKIAKKQLGNWASCQKSDFYYFVILVMWFSPNL